MAYPLEELELLFGEMDEKSQKTVDSFKTELQAIRAGRANPHILDKVLVDYYGVPTPINNMANVTIAEARVLVISHTSGPQGNSFTCSWRRHDVP